MVLLGATVDEWMVKTNSATLPVMPVMPVMPVRVKLAEVVPERIGNVDQAIL